MTEPQRGLWRLIVLVGRGLRLRCPACGGGRIFRGLFTMRAACSECGRPFQRGPGFFLGSIYFNYSVTGLAVIVIYFANFFGEWISDGRMMVLLTLFALVFPLWFFRYARALWIAFDEFWDPTKAFPPAD